MQNKKGFTLIELLVVVLIIGILAAIALPQYEKAVEKSKATQALTMLKSAYQAAMVYYLANGTKPKTFDDMGFEIPWTGNTSWRDSSKDTKSSDEWSLQLYHTSAGDLHIYIGRTSGKYQGAGFVAPLDMATGDLSFRIICVERTASGMIFDSNLPQGAYCEKIMNATRNTGSDGDTYRAYVMP